MGGDKVGVVTAPVGLSYLGGFWARVRLFSRGSRLHVVAGLEPNGSGDEAGRCLDWRNSGFKLDVTFLGLTTFFTGGQIVDDFLVVVGFFSDVY